ncbi:sugar phosphorylase [Listeria weihenstephanensis]|uniref:Sucrose phosphorylase n=1 Tax=Listeria weihenstephanensis TaxID=1006155 RepID=A0A841Z4J7_9LIST|nr:alpha-amylase family glycosyl hydrolase [Listeria weihenstephanensis]MBC1500200.1 sugar phosphorylase [Listeria weihenstephanensis]
MDILLRRLECIYGSESAISLEGKIRERIQEAKMKKLKQRKSGWDQEDVVMITYGDQFCEKDQPTLTTLKKMYDKYLDEMFEVVHILPFYPYSSDDGFSVIDYKKVNPKLGDWRNVADLTQSTRLMFDYVCNHMSAKSDWFEGFLNQDAEYDDFFVSLPQDTDLTAVTRPRATPVLTEFEMADGTKRHIWTTFSADQIDLNFRNPNVLLKMIDVLAFYLEEGAEYIRLDAVGFMWKEPGTSCIHLEKTHEIVKLFRDILDEIAPGTVMITETNVPHKDNITYFGNGQDEAHMVYQFPLPPLVLQAIHTGDGQALSGWARDLELPGENATFFNFLASHDGIGLNPIRGILSEEEILALVADLEKEGALVSYKQNPDGTKSPYEVNVTYMDALNRLADNDDTRLQRFLLAHSILLTIPGVPAVYVQSILGARNDLDGVAETGHNRSINRKKYPIAEIEMGLADAETLMHRTFEGIKEMIQVRKTQGLFHPNVPMEVVDLGKEIFAIRRVDASGDSVLALHNLSDQPISCDVAVNWDILKDQPISGSAPIVLAPYEFRWLTNKN